MQIITRYYDEEILIRRAVDIASPLIVTRRTALFYIHGGGWRSGSRDSFHQHLQYFSRKGYLCASAGYRLAPAVHLQEQMEDVATGYDRFLAYIAERGLDIDRIIVLGSSAGAHLASLLAVTDPRLFKPDLVLSQGWQRPAACVSINGPATLEKWDNMQIDIKRDMEDLLGVSYENESPLFRIASPIVHVDAMSADFLFIIVGKEQFFPHAFIYEMNELLLHNGKYSEVVLLHEAEHGFFYGVSSAHQLEGLSRLEPFIERYG
ncbi:alpha/beta hydrolase [Paenibacillus koleovorans]|uniref:alpha/beta hydrolase n=1 Tax=Paenibacillus koleovorans TaxID=121608 RepID=UPI000FDB8B11|nr:alpha/beta hydrolase [Paenibacillus koleovorans]